MSNQVSTSNWCLSHLHLGMLRRFKPDDQSLNVFPEGINPIEILRKKWDTIPGGNDLRIDSREIDKYSDAEILEMYNRAFRHDTEGLGFGIRGWFHQIYISQIHNKDILDVGSGMGISSIYFAKHGANLHFSDISSSNLEMVRRLCDLFEINARFTLINKISDYSGIEKKFDFILALGSLLNTPLDITRDEISSLKNCMKSGTRFLHLAYPKIRWEREGKLGFEKWGSKTDGPGTPWIEFHDKEKIQYLFSDIPHEIIFDCEFHNSDFNWFDILIK